MVLKHDTLELTPERPSNILYTLKQVRNHPVKGNVFVVGDQNKFVHVFEYDPTAKFESW